MMMILNSGMTLTLRSGRHALISAVITGGLALAVVGCGSSANVGAVNVGAAGAVIGVVAGENFWGDIVSQIGGPHVKVTSIISDPNADPHEFESNAADASALATAGLAVENGLDYDDFMTQLLDASPNDKRTVLSVATVMAIGGDNPNPHLWYDTAKLPDVARAISAALGKIDPADAAVFAANADEFDASLDPLRNTIATIKGKYAGAEIAYTERVPGYLVEAAGLKLGIPASFAQSIEDGNDPSPADAAAFNAAITGKHIKVLLYNGQVTDQETDDIKALATRSGVPIVGVTETLPPQDADFQAWQLRQAKELLAALGG